MKWNEITDFCLVNKIGAEGAKWVSEALKMNKSITYINIACMKFNNEMKWTEITNFSNR